VFTLQPSTLYRLSTEALMKMEADEPQAAAALHEWLALMLAERLSDNNRALEALLD
jgi:hypothetical protein